jgi:hypothetical protein|tara:strand:+ start:2208 stop:2384 length:177 start_codon:yes stop_codon:yes gene_type:complete
MIEYFTRRNKKRNIDNWEEVPDEDLWQDGELHYPEIMHYIYHQVIKQGTWKLIRKKGD